VLTSAADSADFSTKKKIKDALVVDTGQYASRFAQKRTQKSLTRVVLEWSSWSYTDKGEVQSWAGITLDCVRMTMYKFALSATCLSVDERRLAQLRFWAKREAYCPVWLALSTSWLNVSVDRPGPHNQASQLSLICCVDPQLRVHGSR